ncbi:MAG TPA: hypothetical protein PLV05_08950 [Verrucomicrobiota bacterium]|jgi:hypothetical protein|nr:hypothetical protein [Verrucomicrobiota bacterium]OQC25217.1 MAG: hypothetical protein BWX68_01635 [Verrucomicrobia bacterium ADurb.Bin063]HCL91766.1 hypothetical protein [Limisphaerales bacterium]HRR64838.1 hypothetical protein [Candidatus Paceibacterota bacterium]MBP8014840.1 hypothetical protein [Verrucomicrobiota bacterium]
MPTSTGKGDLLRGARVYLSGPMDFVASRAAEKQSGWRNRVSQFLQGMGVTVFDPWFKPDVRGLHEYGREDLKSGERIRRRWTYAGGKRGAQARAWCARQFWETLHIDLRMVDTSDFSISYCPTNIYSVGTPHEIILATMQHKPVLFVSPPIQFPALHELRAHLADDPAGLALLARLEQEIPIKENPRGIPSLWYLPLVGGENFFDGFGFAAYRKRFGWNVDIPIDHHERRFPPQRPLLPFLERLNRRLPRKWDGKLDRFVPDDDWLLWDFRAQTVRGKHIESVRK